MFSSSLFFAPPIFRKLYPGVTWERNPKEKTLYLTFDDGPDPEITPWVLQELNRFNAKATFFCIGQNVERNTQTYSDIIDSGHTTGNHTYSHLNGWKTNNQIYLQDVKLFSAAGSRMLFRPPYGKIRFSQLDATKQLGYEVIMWSVLACDWDPRLNRELAFASLCKYSKPGSILVFHDSQKAASNLKVLLPKVLEYFSQQGYTFAVL